MKVHTETSSGSNRVFIGRQMHSKGTFEMKPVPIIECQSESTHNIISKHPFYMKQFRKEGQDHKRKKERKKDGWIHLGASNDYFWEEKRINTNYRCPAKWKTLELLNLLQKNQGL